MKILITGPCGSGKTTIIEEMKKLGYIITPEYARILWMKGLRDEEFESTLLKKRIEGWNSAKTNKIVFFDRGFVDLITCRKFDKKPILKKFIQAVKKYRFDKVFVLESLDNYKTDGVREHFIKNHKEAQKWLQIMLKTCKEYNYIPFLVKKDSIKNRINFILEKIKNS